jgi:hypothetical protein
VTVAAEDRFFLEAAIYMPCYDPALDTFERWVYAPGEADDSLRKRSPFSITTLILVGAKISDAGGKPLP